MPMRLDEGWNQVRSEFLRNSFPELRFQVLMLQWKQK